MLAVGRRRVGAAARCRSLGASPAPSGPVSFMVFGDPAELAAYQSLVDAFEAANPAIDVELIQVAEPG